MTFVQTGPQPFDCLRSLKRLAVVGIELLTLQLDLEEITGAAGYESSRAQAVKDWTAWKRNLINVLRDSPSTERKLLRWKVVESEMPNVSGNSARQITPEGTEGGELEVSPGTLL